MDFAIRPLRDEDVEAVVAFALRAWEPNFLSMQEEVGPELWPRLHADWRTEQTQAVESSCRDTQNLVWVAESGGQLIGYVVVKFHGEPRPAGEIDMLAVDPDHQRQGVGRALTDYALQQIRSAGYTLVFVGTGGDRGHAPARGLYESAGFTPIPVVHYAQVLK